MHYYVTDPTNGSATGATAKTALCGTMTAEGNIQDSGLVDNKMKTIGSGSPTCTSNTVDLWN